PVTIGTGLDRPPPAFVGEIPVDGAAQTIREGGLRPKPQFTRHLVSTDRIAPIMPRAIFDKSHQFAGAAAVRGRTSWKPRREGLFGSEAPVDLITEDTDQINIRH